MKHINDGDWVDTTIYWVKRIWIIFNKVVFTLILLFGLGSLAIVIFLWIFK